MSVECCVLCEEGGERASFDEHVDGILSEPCLFLKFRFALVCSYLVLVLCFEDLELRGGERGLREEAIGGGGLVSHGEEETQR